MKRDQLEINFFFIINFLYLRQLASEFKIAVHFIHMLAAIIASWKAFCAVGTLIRTFACVIAHMSL